MRTRLIVTLLLATGSLLASCHKQRAQPPQNDAIETPAPAAPAPTPVPDQDPAPAPKRAPVEVKPAPEPTADQQMLDDADATGMTSHAARNTDAQDAGGNGQ